MKKMYLVFLVPLVLILALSGCGPVPSDIMSWLPSDYESGITKLTYKYTYALSDGTSSFYLDNITIYDGTSTESREVLMLVDDGGDKTYLIADKNQKAIYWSGDDVPTDMDTIVLKAEVKNSSTWPTVDFLWGDDVTATILQAKTTYIAAGIEYKDAVQVSFKFFDETFLLEGQSYNYSYYYSPSGGLLSWEYKITDSATDTWKSYNYVLITRN